MSNGLPSDDLLRKVLNLDTIRNVQIDDMLCFYEPNKSINVYELAHKCKEWAYNERYIILTYTGIYINFEVYNSVPKCKVGNLCFEGSSELEYESIFKACEWILNEDR